jgi:hypothetical protein
MQARMETTLSKGNTARAVEKRFSYLGSAGWQIPIEINSFN